MDPRAALLRAWTAVRPAEVALLNVHVRALAVPCVQGGGLIQAAR